MNKTLCIISICLLLLLSFSSTSNGFDNEGAGHSTITNEGARISGDGHAGNRDFDVWLFDQKTGALANFLTGAHDEDCTKYGGKNDNDGNPIPDNCRLQGPNSNQWGNFFEHFYNPQTGAGFGGNRIAIARAKDYERYIKYFICATSTKKYDGLSPIAKTYVNDYFGRIHHLIEDMGVSYHTKLEGHWPTKPIEDYIKNNWDTIVTSKLFEMELAEATPAKGICIDPTMIMKGLASWSHGQPDKDHYWVCSNDLPTRGLASCVFNQAKLEANATMMAARATKFASSYIDQIYNAINTDCICKDEPPRPNPDHPDDNFDVSDLTMKDTQFGMSGYELLDFYTKLALKKGNVAPIYMKQLMEIYAEGRALPADATDEQKNVIDQKFTKILDKLNAQPTKDVETSPDVAILENGYYMQMTALANKNKEPVKIAPVDLSPEIVKDHPVLVIPSAGLYGMEKSAVFKASLDGYVKQGGTLVVFSQQHGYEFEILPVPQETDGTYRAVKGYGWVEDQSCFANSVYTDTYHQILSGQSRATPSFNVDGYFTNYPSNATVVLKRTVNGQPAMIMYEYGQGRVIATSMYSDFAYGSSQTSFEETALIRDLISWTKKPAQLPEAKPGENITIPVSINNVTDTDASQMKFQLYSPDRSQLISEQTISTGLAAHVSTDVTLQYTAPATLGIYHIDYLLLDAQGNIIQPWAETDSGRFAVSNSPANPYKSSDFNFSATTVTDRVPYGDDVLFTVHIWNNTAQSRTITAKYVFPHMYLMTQDSSYGVYSGDYQPGYDSQWLTKTVTVNPNGNVNFNHVMKNAIHDEFIYANFYDENNKYLGSATGGFFVFHPSVKVTIQTDKAEYVRGETLSINTLVANGASFPFQGSVRFTVTGPDNSTVFEDVKPVTLSSNGSSSAVTSFILPESSKTGFYFVRSDLNNGANLLSSNFTAFELPQSQLSISAGLPQSFIVGQNVVSFNVTNTGRIPVTKGNLNISIEDPHGVILYSGSQLFVVAVGESKKFSVLVNIESLSFGEYILSYTLSDETKAYGRLSKRIRNTVALVPVFDKTSYRVRETAYLTATISNAGQFDLADVEVALSIPTLNFDRDEIIGLLRGQSTTLRYSIPIPETISGGLYGASLILSLPSGDSFYQNINLLIPQASLLIRDNGQMSINAGDAISLTVENTGGVDTLYTIENMKVTDACGLVLYQGPEGSVSSIMTGEKKKLIDITIQNQTTQGPVYVWVLLNNGTGDKPYYNKMFTVNGLAAELSARTDKAVYTNTESITGISDILNGTFPIHDGTLNVVVNSSISTRSTQYLPVKGWVWFDRGPGAVAVSKDGFVYVASDYRIHKIDDGGVVATWGGYGSGDNQFYGPSGLAVDDTNGIIYIADGCNIKEFDRNGRFISKWGSCGTADGQFDDHMKIAVGPDNALYVADSYRIQKFDTQGNFITKWGSRGTGTGQFGSDLAGIAVDQDNLVYVIEQYSARVLKFDSNGNFIMQWLTEGNVVGGIAVDRQGFIYIADMNRSAMKYDANGNLVAKLGKWGNGDEDFNDTQGVAVDQDGFVYFTQWGIKRVQKFDGSGNFITSWGSSGNAEGQFNYPFGIALSPDGSLYVADRNNNRIQVFDRARTFIAEWGSAGTNNGQFYGPEGVALGPDGSVYVVDKGNCRVQKFDGNGNFITKWGSCTAGNDRFYGPNSIGVSSDGFVYVADGSRIRKFDNQGNFIADWQSDDWLGHLTISSDGYIYAIGLYIHKFDSNGNGALFSSWSSKGSYDLNNIAAGPNGSIYVYDSSWSDESIQKFDSTGRLVSKWNNLGDNLTGNFYYANGIVVDSNGITYVADAWSHRIIQIDGSISGTLFHTATPINQTAGGNQHLMTGIGALNTSGKLYLQATLTNNLGQIMAKSVYPFYVAQENIAITCLTDKRVYRPGEALTITGEVTNLTPSAVDGVSVILTVQSDDTTNVIYSETLSLPANGRYPFVVTLQPGASGIYRLTAKATHNGVAAFEMTDYYEIALPEASVTLKAPDSPGRSSFTVVLEIKNEGKADIMVNVKSNIDNQIQALTIPAGATKTISYDQLPITQDTTYVFTVTGDVNQTVEKTVYYGYAAGIWAGAAQLYPEGNVGIPVNIWNSGSFDEAITMDIVLLPSGITLQRTYVIPQWQSINDTLYFNLTEGDYTLTLTSQSPQASVQVSFSVRKETKLDMTSPIISTDTSGGVTVITDITNQGCTDMTGNVRMSVVGSGGAVAWQSSHDLSLYASQAPTPQQVILSLNPAAIPTGNYTVVVEAIGSNGIVISSQSMPYTVLGAKIMLSQVPAPVTVSPGEQTTFVFRVTNAGGKEGSAELSLKVYDLTSHTRREWIAPGETKEITISFLAPMDLEEKEYFAEYELREETATVAKGQVKYHLNGINISVNATLDKQNYRDGDTVHLTLTISPRTLFQSVNCFAKANYGGYEEKKDFSLSGTATLTFDVPLAKITGDKLAFGIYHESGRSIHLNSLYIYKTGEAFTITTNKQVYDQGESGTMTITGNQTGTMMISGPGSYSDTFSFTGNATKSFTLPATATAGTYPIEAQLKLTTGEVISSTHPIDIAGIQVKVKEATLDKGKYTASDTMKLTLKIESNTNIAALLKVWITYPDGTSKYLSEKAINLTAAEPLLVSGEYPLTTRISGIHKLVYGICAADLLLASGSEAFDVGDTVLLSIATDKPDYHLGTEPVSVKASMYGTVAATLIFELDGVSIKTESISLNGFSKIDIPLGNVLPGGHRLKATLTAGGLSSVKETSFTYGGNLADLAPDVWGSKTSIGKDTVMKLSVSVTNQGKITSTPTSLTLTDGDTLLATFFVPAIATGEIKAFEYSLQVMGKAGEHFFKAVVDQANNVVEFNRENNTVTRKITIPDIISFTDTQKDTYRTTEQIPITTTIINLTQTTFYPNLTILTVVKDATGVEVFRKSSPFSAPPSKNSPFNEVWTPVNLTEGTYTIAQTIMDGTTTLAQSTKTLTLLQGSGFVVSVSKDNFTLRQGEAISLTISVVPLAGWTGLVNLFVEGVPAGTNISFNPTAGVLPPGNVTMSIATTETTPALSHTLTIVVEGFENGISITQSIPITLTVQGFGITAASQSATIRQLETATFALTASSLNGYEGAITLSQQGGPVKRIAVSIDKSNMAIPNETVVRIQTSKFTQPGNYAVTIAAGDGALVKKVDLPVTVVENVAIAPGLVLTPGPGHENPALVTLVSRSFAPVMEFTAFSTKFGANAVMGDIDGDGEDEIVVAPGPDPRAEGKLRIYRKNGVLVLEKRIFNSHFGLNLAVGDIDGDLKEEIIVGTGPDLLNAPRVKALSWDGSNLVDTGIDFAPYPRDANCIFCDIFQLGVHLATADVDADGTLEIITGPGPGISNKARVKVFKLDTSTGMGNWRAISVLSDFAVRDGNNNHFLFGINIAAGDTDGDTLPEIITGLGPYSPYAPTVKVYESNGTFTGVYFNAYSNILGHFYQSGFGVYVAARDLNGDGLAEIITGSGPSPFNSSWVRIFKGNGSLLNNGFHCYPEHMRYGVKVSTGNVGE